MMLEPSAEALRELEVRAGGRVAEVEGIAEVAGTVGLAVCHCTSFWVVWVLWVRVADTEGIMGEV